MSFEKNVTFQVTNLESLRKKAGLTKSELGRLADVSARTIANAERTGVREETANRIVDAIKRTYVERSEVAPKISVRRIEKQKQRKKKRKEI